MGAERAYRNLWLTTLTPEQHERTCNYWYVVTAEGTLPHDAFTHRHHLLLWLERLGLQCTAPLPEQGEWSVQRLVGEYRTRSYFQDAEEFATLQGEQVRTLSNGEYTLGVITCDMDGIRTLHTLNPKVKDRQVYEYRESREQVG